MPSVQISMQWGSNRIQGPGIPASMNQRTESVLLLYLSRELAYPSLEGNFPFLSAPHLHPLLFPRGLCQGMEMEEVSVTFVKFCWLDSDTNDEATLFSSIVPQIACSLLVVVHPLPALNLLAMESGSTRYQLPLTVRRCDGRNERDTSTHLTLRGLTVTPLAHLTTCLPHPSGSLPCRTDLASCNFTLIPA